MNYLSRFPIFCNFREQARFIADMAHITGESLLGFTERKHVSDFGQQLKTDLEYVMGWEFYFL